MPGTSVETVYAQGSKALLLACVDRVLAGDDEDVPLTDRADFTAALAHPSARTPPSRPSSGLAHVAVRASGLLVAFEDAAAADVPTAGLWPPPSSSARPTAAASCRPWPTAACCLPAGTSRRPPTPCGCPRTPAGRTSRWRRSAGTSTDWSTPAPASSPPCSFPSLRRQDPGMTASPTTGVDTRDMLVVHDSIRRQSDQVPALVRGVAPGDLDRAAVVADHAELLSALLHHHHQGEDRLLWPVLQLRVPADVAETVARMESQHDGIAELQKAVTAALAAWRARAGADEREALAAAWEALYERVREHLAAEEAHILPLAAAHMTPAEWQRLGEEGMGDLPLQAAAAGLRHADVLRRPRGDPRDAVARPAPAAAGHAAAGPPHLRALRLAPARDDDPVNDRSWRTSGRSTWWCPPSRRPSTRWSAT